MSEIERPDRREQRLCRGLAGVTGSLFVSLLMLGLAGCQADFEAAKEGARFAVQNLYVGADLAALLSAESPEAVPALVAREFANIQTSDFPSRAEAIAAALTRHRPHLIGLQEVSSFRLQSPGDVLEGNPRQAEDVVLDFLPALLEALRTRGAEYREVVRYSGMGRLDDVRLRDAGVILARADVAATDPRSGNFQTNLVVQVGGESGFPVMLLGGWASVKATVAGHTYRFVTTHLESGDLAPEVQEAQARELLETLSDESQSVVMVGDFSSTPDGAMTATYERVREAGFVDLWQAARPQDPGVTCCQAPDLRNPGSMLGRRLDFVFFRNAPDRRDDPVGKVIMTRIGAESDDRTASGLWPSDHAGLVATLSSDEEADGD
jgi:endonuclease/exonuclease/phosphatase family metal-dependent hydrolase